MRPLLVERGRDRLAVDLHGHGRVGRALRERLGAHGLELASVTTSRGTIEAHPTRGARVFVDATAPRYGGTEAEAWVARLESVLRAGTPVVTANKAPLALAWARLERAARAGGTTLSCSATVGGGTPVLALLQRVRLAHGLTRIEATLSGTLAFVLARAGEGVTLDDAVREAQRAGYAEPDPKLDLDGTDAYAKALILHNRLFPEAGPLTLASRGVPLRLRQADIHLHLQAGRVPQVVATVEAGRVEVRLEGREPARSLAGPPASVVVHATTRDGAHVGLTGPGAGPDVTAGALLADLAALRERAPGLPGGMLP